MSDFNSWFKKKFRDLHDAILCGDLVAGNYKKVSKKSYEAGQQSRQKEIDELNLTIKRLITSEEDIARGCKHWRDAHRELDERITKALAMLEDEAIEVDYDEYRFVGNFVDADKLKEILK